MTVKCLPVLPTNYRRIVLHILESHPDCTVLLDKKPVTDFSTDGPITQRGIRSALNFLILSPDGEEVCSFHDHPNQMYFAPAFGDLALACQQHGWLKIQ